MLIVTRKTNEAIVIRDDIVVTVVSVRGDTVRLGVEALEKVTVHRCSAAGPATSKPDGPSRSAAFRMARTERDGPRLAERE